MQMGLPSTVWMLLAIFCGVNCQASCIAQETAQEESAVEHAKKCSKAEFSKYIIELAEEKNVEALLAISKSNHPNRDRAIIRLVRLLPASDAVAFCADLEIGSLDWQAAMCGLRAHSRAHVIGYIKQIATSTNAEARYCCYENCIAKKWDDLKEQALADVHCNEKLAIKGIFASTISEEAQEYLANIVAWMMH
jgi:hypothetical protein